jgi:hypothetical protein
LEKNQGNIPIFVVEDVVKDHILLEKDIVLHVVLEDLRRLEVITGLTRNTMERELFNYFYFISENLL